MPAYIIYKFEENKEKDGVLTRGAYFTGEATKSEIFYSALLGALFIQIAPLTELMEPGKKLSRKMKNAWKKKVARYTEVSTKGANEQCELPDDLRKQLNIAALWAVKSDSFMNDKDEI